MKDFLIKYKYLFISILLFICFSIITILSYNNYKKRLEDENYLVEEKNKDIDKQPEELYREIDYDKYECANKIVSNEKYQLEQKYIFYVHKTDNSIYSGKIDELYHFTNKEDYNEFINSKEVSNDFKRTLDENNLNINYERFIILLACNGLTFSEEYLKKLEDYNYTCNEPIAVTIE